MLKEGLPVPRDRTEDAERKFAATVGKIQGAANARMTPPEGGFQGFEQWGMMEKISELMQIMAFGLASWEGEKRNRTNELKTLLADRGNMPPDAVQEFFAELRAEVRQFKVEHARAGVQAMHYRGTIEPKPKKNKDL